MSWLRELGFGVLIFIATPFAIYVFASLWGTLDEIKEATVKTNELLEELSRNIESLRDDVSDIKDLIERRDEPDEDA
jgi:hypothetical protein